MLYCVFMVGLVGSGWGIFGGSVFGTFVFGALWGAIGAGSEFVFLCVVYMV